MSDQNKLEDELNLIKHIAVNNNYKLKTLNSNVIIRIQFKLKNNSEKATFIYHLLGIIILLNSFKNIPQNTICFTSILKHLK